MRVVLVWLAGVIAAVALYFLSSGLAFAAMYRVGRTFPSRLASRIYAPLEWLAARSDGFRDAYNGFHAWCYKWLVNREIS
jgi:hypothetical protein